MTIRQNVPPGAPCWVDLMSSSLDRSKEFYGALFGWTAETAGPEYGGYTTFLLDGEGVGGLMPCQPGQGPTDVWSVYLTVEDAAATVRAARDNGGQVIVDAMPVGDLGVMAVVSDPSGGVVGMWQPGQHRGGVVGVDGAPCHFELATRDYDAAIAFYEAVFGWKTEQMPEGAPFRYAVLDVGDGEGAGIMDAAGFLPEGVPSHWAIYFAVPSVDKALAQAAELGGATVTPGEDTPYGRLATATDSNGAMFKLRSGT